MVLVIIGVVMGAVMVGTDVLRHAKSQQAFSVFVSGWRDAFSQYVQVVGRVPRDAATPINIINGEFGGGRLCDRALTDVFLRSGVRIPQGRGVGGETRYVYQDSVGSPRELQVCFETMVANPGVAGTGWSVQSGSIPTAVFTSVNRHVMVLTGLTAELAMQMDVLIDGNASARFGQFRRDIFSHVTNDDQADWMNPNEIVTTQVTALFEMF